MTDIQTPSQGRRRPGRAPVSCAECRRLKLRCDRKVPCETCRKRGCGALCPTGTMQTGKSNRTMALLNADEMQAKIDRLTAQVHQLEDALRRTQGTISEGTHSVVDDASPGRSPVPPQNSTVSAGEEQSFLNAFGTLSVGQAGDARYFGNTARSEYLIHAPSQSLTCRQPTYPGLSQDIVDASLSFEIGIPEIGEPDLRSKLMDMLPTFDQTTRLCDIYIENGQYLWGGINRDELHREIVGPAYATQGGTNEVTSAHGLSLLFIVLALATLFDMDKAPCSVEAEEYYLLSRAALRLASPLDHTTLWSIHSLLQMSYYLELSDKDFSHRRTSLAWLHIGMAVRLAYGIGLHVNNSHWGLDATTSEKRSNLFWQIFVKDTWMSFSFGRPPGVSLAYIDCEISDQPLEEYHPWMFRYSRLLHTVMTTAFGAVKPAYKVILELDRKIRDFAVTNKMGIRCGEVEDPPPTFDMLMNRWLGMSAKEATLVHLHRPYFAQALAENPGDLLKHKFAPSVVSIYRSAWRLIEGVLQTFSNAPQMMARVPIWWSQALASAIVMCLIVTRAPSSNLAGPALRELDNLHTGTLEASKTCPITANNLAVIKKLCNQGHEAMSKVQLQPHTLRELDRLGGKSQLVTTESPSEFASPVQNAVPVLPHWPEQQSLRISNDMLAFLEAENVHPTILDDWKAFWELTANSQVPPPRPLAMFDEPSRGDVEMIYNLDASNQQHNDLRNGVFELGSFTNGVAPPASPLALDPVWHSFVEQLGF